MVIKFEVFGVSLFNLKVKHGLVFSQLLQLIQFDRLPLTLVLVYLSLFLERVYLHWLKKAIFTSFANMDF